MLLDEITSKNEENSYLREALKRTDERLNQEKRLNTAIKQKKTFHLENLDKRSPPPRHASKRLAARAVLRRMRQSHVRAIIEQVMTLSSLQALVY